MTMQKYEPIIVSVLELGYCTALALSLAYACIFGGSTP
jgi:hypothetical protein